MNRTLKEATVRRYHYDTHQQLQDHLAAFQGAYNFAKRLKTLRGLTLHEAVCKTWAAESERFKHDSAHLTSGVSTKRRGVIIEQDFEILLLDPGNFGGHIDIP